MNFTRIRFLVFLALFVAVYRFGPGLAARSGRSPARIRAILLLLASYVYYCTWSAPMALLLAAATSAAYLGAKAIESAQSERVKRFVMSALVCGLVGVLALFKAAPFLHQLIHRDLLVPLGISYYTFKLVGYVVDVYWGKTAAERDWVSFAAYVAFFPQILAGPIQRSEGLLPQIHKPPGPSVGGVVLGSQRILLGFFKKFVVADNLAALVDFIYSHLHAPGTPLIAGFYAYTLQLYADFSGLTDLAVGTALTLGFQSPENFMAPFWSATVGEFWRRWHITLTSWLTDYVFLPLRMATRTLGNLGLVLSLFVNTVLIGLWHNIDWSFALFGAVHGAYLSVEALTARMRKRFFKSHPAAGRAADWIAPLITFHLVAASFVIFRADNWRNSLYLLSHLGQGISAPSGEWLAFWQTNARVIRVGLGGYAVMEAADFVRRRIPQAEAITALPRWGRWALYSCTGVSFLLMLLLLLTAKAQPNPFIYAVF